MLHFSDRHDAEPTTLQMLRIGGAWENKPCIINEAGCFLLTKPSAVWELVKSVRAAAPQERHH